MPPPGGNGGAEVGGWLDEPLTKFEVRDNKCNLKGVQAKMQIFKFG